jgi:hypothetical protein
VARGLTEVLHVKVDPATKAALVARAEADYRSVGAVIRAAIRTHLEKGKR